MSWTEIQRYSGTSPNLAFDNLPQTYKNLRVIGSVKTSTNATQRLTLRINNETSNYVDTHWAVYDTTNTVGAVTNRAYVGDLARLYNNGDQANFVITINGYTGVRPSVHYFYTADFTGVESFTNSQFYSHLYGGHDDPTSLTKLTFYNPNGNNWGRLDLQIYGSD